MILKLKAIVTDHLIDGQERLLTKQYELRNRLTKKIAEASRANHPSNNSSLKLDDIKALLEKDSSITLEVEGKKVTLNKGAHSAASSSSSSSTHNVVSVGAEGTDDTETMTVVETISVPEPSSELLAEIDGCFKEISFSASDVDEIIASRLKPKSIIDTSPEELAGYNSTMALARIEVFQPDSSEPVIAGTFINASVFTSCSDDECDACADSGDEPVNVLNYIPDGEDRNVVGMELDSQLHVRLSL